MPDFFGSRRGNLQADRAKAQRELTGREIRTAIFGDLQPTDGDPLLQASVEANYAIDHELHEAVAPGPGQLAIALCRDDAGQVIVRQPVAHAVDLAHLGVSV